MTSRETVPSAAHGDELVSAATLEEYGAGLVEVGRGEILFQQGDKALYFYVVQRGTVKMAVYSEKGREFVQGFFSARQSFGEPPFFARSRYPASAIAVEDSAVWKCDYRNFVRLLREHADVHLRLTEILSSRLIYKATMIAEIAIEEAEHRLRTVVDYFRTAAETPEGKEFKVPFTRQQLADMTGLRVETVIRTIKALEEEGLLQIEGGKILWSPER